MSSLPQEFAIALRSLRKSRIFTLVAIVSLGLSIGAATAIFALIDAVLLRPLPGISDPSRLVSLYNQSTSNPDALSSSSWRDYEYYRDHNRVFSGLMAYLRLAMPVEAGDHAESVRGELVSTNYFDALGVHAQIGRTFSGVPDVDAPVVVLSDKFWRDRFNGRPNAIGQPLRIGGHPFTIIGVAPPDFRGVVLDWGERPQFWVPAQRYREAAPALRPHELLRGWGMRAFVVTGRLQNGSTLRQAAAEMRALATRIDSDYPDRAKEWKQEGARWTVSTFPLNQARFWPGARTKIVSLSLVLISVAAGVLLIACVNIASLMLTRAARRQKEIAARLALGAGPSRIARLLLTESLMIATAGGAAGWIVAELCVRSLSNFPRLLAIPMAVDLRLDLRILVLVVLITTVAGVTTGLAPLRQVLAADVISNLRTAGVANRNRHGAFTFRSFLLATEISLTVTLVVGAGLFLSTLRNATNEDPFLQAGNLLLMNADAVSQGQDRKLAARTYSEVLERIQALPGIRAAGLTNVLPSSGVRALRDLTILQPKDTGLPQRAKIDVSIISPGYFQAIAAPIFHGRDFERADRENSLSVAIVDEQMANRYWRGDAIGQQIALGTRTATVVGIVGYENRRNYRQPPVPTVYVPVAQESPGDLSLVLRTAANPLAILSLVQAVASGLSGRVVIDRPQTLSSYANTVLDQERLAVWCLGALATLAVILSTIGLYGAMAYSVSQRTAEIGLRMALGANPRTVISMVLAAAAKIAASGAIAGAGLSLFAAQYARSLLYGVTATDPATWLVAGCILSLAVLISSVLPALRASRIAPASALRSD
jgi:predicted permease